jgi:hypothetical protein
MVAARQDVLETTCFKTPLDPFSVHPAVPLSLSKEAIF